MSKKIHIRRPAVVGMYPGSTYCGLRGDNTDCGILRGTCYNRDTYRDVDHADVCLNCLRVAKAKGH